MKTKNWLKEKRKKEGLTQEELAKKINLSPFTIMQIEQGKRLGSIETWKKIENFFSDKNEIKISYENQDIINELKDDILEFGINEPCILIYKIINNNIIFTNYDFIVEEIPFNSKEELEKDERYIKTTLQYALEVFEEQNKII